MRQPDVTSLLSALKKILKTRKITYRQLAAKIGVTEITLKRFFTSEDFAYSRIVDVCSALEIPFAQLIEMTTRQGGRTFTLSEKQETHFARHPEQYAFFRRLVLAGGLPDAKIPKKTLYVYLQTLEKLGLIEWKPSDAIKLKVHGTHNWLLNGPLQKAFLRSGIMGFMDYLLQSKNGFHTSSDRMVTPETAATFQRELQALAVSFRDRAYQDEVLHRNADLIPVKWVLGFAPYETPWLKV